MFVLLRALLKICRFSHAVAMSVFIICRGLCACTEM